MRGHNICFTEEILKIIPVTPSYLEPCIIKHGNEGMERFEGEGEICFCTQIFYQWKRFLTPLHVNMCWYMYIYFFFYRNSHLFYHTVFIYK